MHLPRAVRLEVNGDFRPLQNGLFTLRGDIYVLRKPGSASIFKAEILGNKVVRGTVFRSSHLNCPRPRPIVRLYVRSCS